jgi:Transposase DNA-binding
MAAGPPTWLDGELGGCHLADERLTRRLHKLLGQIGGAVGQSIPFACQDWANAKAAYRFLSNERVNEADVLAGHFQSTRERAGGDRGPDPRIARHDGVQLPEGGIAGDRHHEECQQRTRQSRPRAVSYGLRCADAFEPGIDCGWRACRPGRGQGVDTREVQRDRGAQEEDQPDAVPIEAKESIRWLDNLAQSTDLLADPARCVHIGDRESDIYEIFCLAHDLGTHFLLRTCVNRRAGDGDHTVADEMDEIAVKKRHRIEVRDDSGNPDHALLEIRYRKIRILPPIGKWKRYPALELTVIHAEETAGHGIAREFAGS